MDPRVKPEDDEAERPGPDDKRRGMGLTVAEGPSTSVYSYHGPNTTFVFEPVAASFSAKAFGSDPR